jgi:UDP-3-O-[3-hydroxymyristoyl] glucosamine N-acyltransferase
MTAAEIVEYLQGIGQEPVALGNADAKVDHAADIEDSEPLALSWLRDGEHRASWNASVLIAGKGGDGVGGSPDQAAILCNNPRLSFMKIITHFFEHQVRQRCVPNVAASADVHRTAVIGAEGQGYEWDNEAGLYVSMPHLAGVVIGPDVVIGPHSTIMRGVLKDTRIGRGTKIGNGVNIGHGVSIGEHCIIVAHATVGGSTRVGSGVTIWQGAMIANRLRIGDGATIGMGAVVLNDVPEGETWVGNPARKIR